MISTTDEGFQLYTTHSYIPEHFEVCAGVLARVIQAISQDPSSVEIRYKGKFFRPVNIPYAKFDPTSLGELDFLSGAAWGPLEGVRIGSAWLRINGGGSHLMVYKSHPKTEICRVGPRNADSRYDNSSLPYLQVTREDVLERLLARLVLE
jgi:hypothetical protein